MKYVTALNFMELSIIMMGLFFIAKTNHGRLGQSSNYWSLAIVCDALGLALMGVMLLIVDDFNHSSFIGTMANTLLFAAIIYQSASIRALTREVSSRSAWHMAGSVLVFLAVWDYARHTVDTNTRVLFFAVCALVALLWQLHELGKHKSNFTQIKIIRYLVIGEILFVALRFIAVASVNVKIVQVEQLPMLGLFSIWVQYGLKVVVYGGLLAYWSEDLAKQKLKAELETQQFKELSERQEKLIADLGRLNKAATAGVMAASIAHELSQPLQSLVLNIGLSLDEMKADKRDPQFVMEMLREQEKSAMHMVEVVNTMRGVFTETSARETEVDLFEMIQRLAVLVSSQASKRGIAVEYLRAGDGLVRIRPPELQQVLLNLIGNAFDALGQSKPTAPQVRVSVANEGAWVVCRVEDNGPGIPDDQHEDVFKFLNTTKTTGMGLGLWLCKYIVERNGGHISAQRSQLGGALIAFKLRAHHLDA